MKSKCEPGAVFGRWTVIERIDKKKVTCRCECGEIKSVYRSNITSGKSLSCGCLAKEVNSKRMSTHGESETKLYGVWRTMRSRCYLKSTKSYKDYGGRGIRVCADWKNSYESFRNWSTSHGYRDGLTIDRTENNKNYTPENCTWNDRQEQCNNKRNNHWVTIAGETHTLAQWRRSNGLTRGALEGRLQRGWDEDKLLVPSQLGNNQFTHF